MAKIPRYAWMNGEIIPWENARVHIRSESFMTGANVFEGIRAYASADGRQLNLFRNAEHMDRLFNCSMRILRMRMKWTAEDLTRAEIELLKANEVHEDVLVRPTVYFDMGEHFGLPEKLEIGCAITALSQPQPGLQEGVRVRTSTWGRIDDLVMPPRAKAGANYLNSRFAAVEARMDGYDTAILLTHSGKVAEGLNGCVMIVRQGKLFTPPVTAGILESVTRATLMELFREEMGIEVVEREVDRTELYVADELFLCGSGVEVLPVVSVDRYQIGSGQPGPIVRNMQTCYFRVVRGQNAKYSHWLTPVYA